VWKVQLGSLDPRAQQGPWELRATLVLLVLSDPRVRRVWWVLSDLKARRAPRE